MADYELKHNDLKRQIRDAEAQNEEMILKIQRTKRLIQRARLERTILLERLEQASGLKADPATVESPPASPIEPVAANAAAAPGEKKKEASERRRTTPRDPRLPKRPQNAYIIFCEAERENVKRRLEEEKPGENHDLTKAMSEAWKGIGNDGRKKYTDLYREDRLRYLKEMANFPSLGLSATDQKEKQRAIKQLKEVETQDAVDKSGAESNDEQTEDEKIIKKEEPATDFEPASEPPSEPTME